MAAIEFALIAPLFLMIVFGILIYGVFFGTWIAISQAAAEGARASVAGMSTTERTVLANAAALRVLSDYGVLLDAQHWTIESAPGSAAHTFQVKVTYDLTNRGFANYLDLKLLPSSKPAATVTVGFGGY